MDNESKHTPGEWRLLSPLGSFKDSTLYVIAQPNPASREVSILFDAGPADDEENLANARLAVASKGFYEAALELRHNAGPVDINAHPGDRGPLIITRKIFDAFMEALDKAEG